MKKLLLSFLMLAFVGISVSAATYDAEKRVSTVGAEIMKKNGLPSVTFKVTESADNSSIATTNVFYVDKTALTYAGNDNEVAAVIAGELGAIVNASASKKEFVTSIANSIVQSIGDEKLQNAAYMTSELSLTKMSNKDRRAADITGVDLMVKAGYNPLAMIVVLGKNPGSMMEILRGRPSNFARTMNIYDYLSYNYPAKVKAGYACNEYRNFLAYVNPIVKKRESSASAKAKFQRTQAIAKQKRANELARYKATNGASGWDVSRALLESFTEVDETK